MSMFSQCLSDGSVVRALSVARVSVASQIVATFLLDHGHARFILCWLCVVSLFVCFVTHTKSLDKRSDKK